MSSCRPSHLALGLIAAGAIWLVSDKDSKFPSMPSRGKKPQAGTKDELDIDGSDVHHRDYVTHMSSLEMRDGEDDLAFQRRRDIHRANFLMCERNPDEDDTGFRQRLNEMTDKFRDKRRAWSDSVGQTGSAASHRTQQLASQASGKAQDLYGSKPLVGGMLAAAVGAAFASAVPVSRQEKEKLGILGLKARDMASEQKDLLISKAMEKKDELPEKADEKLQQGQPKQSRQPEPAVQAGSPTESISLGGSDQGPAPDGAFILPERNR